MTVNTYQIVSEIIDLFSEMNKFKGIKVSIRDGQDNVINVKFRTFSKIGIDHIYISPAAIDDVIKSNFTIFERWFYKHHLAVICVETLLIFSSKLISYGSDVLYDDIIDLVKNKPSNDITNKDIDHRRRRLLEFIKDRLLPTAEDVNVLYNSKFYSDKMKWKKRFQIMSIFSRVILVDFCNRVIYNSN